MDLREKGGGGAGRNGRKGNCSYDVTYEKIKRIYKSRKHRWYIYANIS